MQGLVISFEGIDQCGKNTQIKLLSGWLDKTGVKHVVGREPGGTAWGEAARRFLQDPHFLSRMNKTYKGVEGTNELNVHEKLTWKAEAFGYMQVRSQFSEHLIAPALAAGAVFIADRCMDSTTAYQGYGLADGDPETIAFLRRANEFVLSETPITRTYLIDISSEERARRKKTDMEFGSHHDRIELRGDKYYQKVRAGYLKLAEQEPQRIMVIDGTLSREEIHQKIADDLSRLLKRQGLLTEKLKP